MHIIIVGMTGSGKTEMAKLLSREYAKQGVKSLVLSPFAPEDGWAAELQTKNVQEFLSVVYAKQGYAVFIDEVYHYRKEKGIIELATMGRHWRHIVHFISQRVMMIPIDVRCNCSKAISFEQSPENADVLYQQFNEPAFLETPKLGKGHCIIKKPGQPPEKRDISGLFGKY